MAVRDHLKVNDVGRGVSVVTNAAGRELSGYGRGVAGCGLVPPEK